MTGFPRGGRAILTLGAALATCTLLGAMLGVTFGAGFAAAETSSWAGRVDGPAAPIQRKAPAAKSAPVKVIKTVPQAGDTQAPISPPEKSSSYTKQPPLGDDAAYEAFDQGQYVTALQLGVKAAERGEPTAHTLVGRIYAEGLGTSKNSGLAAQWYARGAELGDPEAMLAYGLMLADGQGIDQDRVAAGRYFEAAAAKKHLLANYNLALLFLRGDGKPENPHRALMHMRFAAEFGVVAAQYDLGTMYATGQGTTPTRSKRRNGSARPLRQATPRRRSTTR